MHVWKALSAIGILICAIGLNQIFGIDPYCAYQTCDRLEFEIID